MDVLKTAFVFLGLLLTVVQPAYAASWLTTVEDDVLTDGKKASMVGQISLSSAVYVGCTSGGAVNIAYVEKGTLPENLDVIPFRMVLQADGGAKHWIDAKAYPHNSEFFGFGGEMSAASAAPILKDIRDGKRKLNIGITADVVDFKWTGTARLSGSTKATRRLLGACGISVD